MRLIVYFNSNTDQFINIEADSMERKDEFIYAYKGEKLVGMFDVGIVVAIYLSEKR